MELKEIVELVEKAAEDEETRESIVALVTELKAKYYPILGLAKELVGEDLDLFMDETLKYTARKTKVLYDAFIIAGFSRDEALALTISKKIDISTELKNAKS